MLRLNLSFFGGRGSSSGGGGSYNNFNNVNAANAALGLDNGGETDRWTAGLSKEEKADFNLYTRNGFSKINGTLRKLKDGKDVNPDSAVGQRINRMEEAINRYKLTEPTVFHRVGNSIGLLDRATRMEILSSSNGDALELSAIKSMVGQVIHDKGFTSTSASTDKTRSTGIIDNLRYHIKTPSGKGIGAYIPKVSHFKTAESEFLFNRGSAFKISEVRAEKGLIHIDMEYVGRSH